MESGGDYYSPTTDIRGYTGVSLMFVPLEGDSVATIQVSPDGLAWTVKTTVSVSSGVPTIYNYVGTDSFLRVISTTDIDVTLWHDLEG